MDDYNNVQKILHHAARREEEAYAFYKSVAGRMKNKAVSEIFEELASQESDHLRLVTGWSRNPDIANRFLFKEADYKITEGVDLPQLSIEMKPAEAFVLAMKKELEAAEFYRMLSEKAVDGGLSQILKSLVEMELSHKRKIEDAFVNVGYPEVF
jgi:rubrerythrin